MDRYSIILRTSHYAKEKIRFDFFYQGEVTSPKMEVTLSPVEQGHLATLRKGILALNRLYKTDSKLIALVKVTWKTRVRTFDMVFLESLVDTALMIVPRHLQFLMIDLNETFLYFFFKGEEPLEVAHARWVTPPITAYLNYVYEHIPELAALHTPNLAVFSNLRRTAGELTAIMFHNQPADPSDAQIGAVQYLVCYSFLIKGLFIAGLAQ